MNLHRLDVQKTYLCHNFEKVFTINVSSNTSNKSNRSNTSSNISNHLANISSNISASFKYHPSYHSIYHNIYTIKYIKDTKYMRYINIYIIKCISFIFCWIRLFKLKCCSQGLEWLWFLTKINKCTDFVYRKKTSELRFCSWFRNRYLNGFNTSICFIRRLHFQKTKSY